MSRQYSKSLLRRLEEIEAKIPGQTLFEVTLGDGATKDVKFPELKEIAERDGLPPFRVIDGLTNGELDFLISTVKEEAERRANDGH